MRLNFVIQAPMYRAQKNTLLKAFNAFKKIQRRIAQFLWFKKWQKSNLTDTDDYILKKKNVTGCEIDSTLDNTFDW